MFASGPVRQTLKWESPDGAPKLSVDLNLDWGPAPVVLESWI